MAGSELYDGNTHSTVHLTQKEAVFRKSLVSDVAYKMDLAILSGDQYFGKANITFKMGSPK
jgi:hypothetical protein